MGGVLRFPQQPRRNVADALKAPAPIVPVAVRSSTDYASFILAGAELAFAWSELLLCHAVSIVGRASTIARETSPCRSIQRAEVFGDRTP